MMAAATQAAAPRPRAIIQPAKLGRFKRDSYTQMHRDIERGAEPGPDLRQGRPGRARHYRSRAG